MGASARHHRAQHGRQRAHVHRAQQASQRAAPSRPRHHRAQQARQRAAPSRAAWAPVRGTIARSKQASARHHRATTARKRAAPSSAAWSCRHHRAQQARQRAAPSRADSDRSRGTIARSRRSSARHHRVLQARRQRGTGTARPRAGGCEQRTLAGKDAAQARAGHAAGRSRGTLPTLARQAARAHGASSAGSRGRHSTRARPGLFVPVGTSLAGGGREVAMPLSALLPLFHGGRMLQLASVMRETTTGSGQASDLF